MEKQGGISANHSDHNAGTMHLSPSASPASRRTPSMLAKTLDVVLQTKNACCLKKLYRLSSTLLLRFVGQLLGLIQYLGDFRQIRNRVASMTNKQELLCIGR